MDAGCAESFPVEGTCGEIISCERVPLKNAYVVNIANCGLVVRPQKGANHERVRSPSVGVEVSDVH